MYLDFLVDPKKEKYWIEGYKYLKSTSSGKFKSVFLFIVFSFLIFSLVILAKVEQDRNVDRINTNINRALKGKKVSNLQKERLSYNRKIRDSRKYLNSSFKDPVEEELYIRNLTATEIGSSNDTPLTRKGLYKKVFNDYISGILEFFTDLFEPVKVYILKVPVLRIFVYLYLHYYSVFYKKFEYFKRKIEEENRR